jgi:hypothetical protein
MVIQRWIDDKKQELLESIRDEALSRDLGTQGLDLFGYLYQGRACLCHAGVFGADEAGVRGNRVADSGYGARELVLELLAHDFDQAPLQFL